MSAAREGLAERLLGVSSPFRRTKNPDTHLGIWIFAFGRKDLNNTIHYLIDIYSISVGRTRYGNTLKSFRNGVEQVSAQDRQMSIQRHAVCWIPDRYQCRIKC